MDQSRVDVWIELCVVLWDIGGKNVFQTATKRARGPKCPVTGKRIAGVSPISAAFIWCCSGNCRV